MTKEFFGYFSLLLTVISGLPYIWSMLKGETRPHLFSWVIWTLACAIAAAAQYIANSGPGAWSTAMSAVLCVVVLALSLTQKADWSITKSDWAAFITALAIIPIWYFTQSPLVAAILATLIDALAYYPTFRKSWNKPRQEMASLYFIANLKHLASIFAIISYCVTTLVMPATMLAVNAGLIILLLWRRRVIGLLT